MTFLTVTFYRYRVHTPAFTLHSVRYPLFCTIALRYILPRYILPPFTTTTYSIRLPFGICSTSVHQHYHRHWVCCVRLPLHHFCFIHCVHVRSTFLPVFVQFYYYLFRCSFDVLPVRLSTIHTVYRFYTWILLRLNFFTDSLTPLLGVYVGRYISTVGITTTLPTDFHTTTTPFLPRYVVQTLPTRYRYHVVLHIPACMQLPVRFSFYHLTRFYRSTGWRYVALRKGTLICYRYRYYSICYYPYYSYCRPPLLRFPTHRSLGRKILPILIRFHRCHWLLHVLISFSFRSALYHHFVLFRYSPFYTPISLFGYSTICSILHSTFCWTHLPDTNYLPVHSPPLRPVWSRYMMHRYCRSHQYRGVSTYLPHYLCPHSIDVSTFYHRFLRWPFWLRFFDFILHFHRSVITFLIPPCSLLLILHSASAMRHLWSLHSFYVWLAILIFILPCHHLLFSLLFVTVSHHRYHFTFAILFWRFTIQVIFLDCHSVHTPVITCHRFISLAMPVAFCSRLPLPRLDTYHTGASAFRWDFPFHSAYAFTGVIPIYCGILPPDCPCHSILCSSPADLFYVRYFVRFRSYHRCDTDTGLFVTILLLYHSPFCYVCWKWRYLLGGWFYRFSRLFVCSRLWTGLRFCRYLFHIFFIRCSVTTFCSLPPFTILTLCVTVLHRTFVPYRFLHYTTPVPLLRFVSRSTVPLFCHHITTWFLPFYCCWVRFSAITDTPFPHLRFRCSTLPTMPIYHAFYRSPFDTVTVPFSRSVIHHRSPLPRSLPFDFRLFSIHTILFSLFRGGRPFLRYSTIDLFIWFHFILVRFYTFTVFFHLPPPLSVRYRSVTDSDVLVAIRFVDYFIHLPILDGYVHTFVSTPIHSVPTNFSEFVPIHSLPFSCLPRFTVMFSFCSCVTPLPLHTASPDQSLWRSVRLPAHRFCVHTPACCFTFDLLRILGHPAFVRWMLHYRSTPFPSGAPLFTLRFYRCSPPGAFCLGHRTFSGLPVLPVTVVLHTDCSLGVLPLPQVTTAYHVVLLAVIRSTGRYHSHHFTESVIPDFDVCSADCYDFVTTIPIAILIRFPLHSDDHIDCSVPLEHYIYLLLFSFLYITRYIPTFTFDCSRFICLLPYRLPRVIDTFYRYHSISTFHSSFLPITICILILHSPIYRYLTVLRYHAITILRCWFLPLKPLFLFTAMFRCCYVCIVTCYSVLHYRWPRSRSATPHTVYFHRYCSFILPPCVWVLFSPPFVPDLIHLWVSTYFHTTAAWFTFHVSIDSFCSIRFTPYYHLFYRFGWAGTTRYLRSVCSVYIPPFSLGGTLHQLTVYDSPLLPIYVCYSADSTLLEEYIFYLVCCCYLPTISTFVTFYHYTEFGVTLFYYHLQFWYTRSLAYYLPFHYSHYHSRVTVRLRSSGLRCILRSGLNLPLLVITIWCNLRFCCSTILPSSAFWYTVILFIPTRYHVRPTLFTFYPPSLFPFHATSQWFCSPYYDWLHSVVFIDDYHTVRCLIHLFYFVALPRFSSTDVHLLPVLPRALRFLTVVPHDFTPAVRATGLPHVPIRVFCYVLPYRYTSTVLRSTFSTGTFCSLRYSALRIPLHWPFPLLLQLPPQTTPFWRSVLHADYWRVIYRSPFSRSVYRSILISVLRSATRTVWACRTGWVVLYDYLPFFYPTTVPCSAVLNYGYVPCLRFYSGDTLCHLFVRCGDCTTCRSRDSTIHLLPFRSTCSMRRFILRYDSSILLLRLLQETCHATLHCSPPPRFVRILPGELPPRDPISFVWAVPNFVRYRAGSHCLPLSTVLPIVLHFSTCCWCPDLTTLIRWSTVAPISTTIRLIDTDSFVDSTFVSFIPLQMNRYTPISWYHTVSTYPLHFPYQFDSPFLLRLPTTLPSICWSTHSGRCSVSVDIGAGLYHLPFCSGVITITYRFYYVIHDDLWWFSRCLLLFLHRFYRGMTVLLPVTILFSITGTLTCVPWVTVLPLPRFRYTPRLPLRCVVLLLPVRFTTTVYYPPHYTIHSVLAIVVLFCSFLFLQCSFGRRLGHIFCVHCRPYSWFHRFYLCSGIIRLRSAHSGTFCVPLVFIVTFCAMIPFSFWLLRYRSTVRYVYTFVTTCSFCVHHLRFLPGRFRLVPLPVRGATTIPAMNMPYTGALQRCLLPLRFSRIVRSLPLPLRFRATTQLPALPYLAVRWLFVHRSTCVACLLQAACEKDSRSAVGTPAILGGRCSATRAITFWATRCSCIAELHLLPPFVLVLHSYYDLPRFLRWTPYVRSTHQIPFTTCWLHTVAFPCVPFCSRCHVPGGQNCLRSHDRTYCSYRLFTDSFTTTDWLGATMRFYVTGDWPVLRCSTGVDRIPIPLPPGRHLEPFRYLFHRYHCEHLPFYYQPPTYLTGYAYTVLTFVYYVTVRAVVYDSRFTFTTFTGGLMPVTLRSFVHFHLPI